MNHRTKRLQALEAACRARPSADALAEQMAADLATVYGGPAVPLTWAELQAITDEVYREDA